MAELPVIIILLLIDVTGSLITNILIANGGGVAQEPKNMPNTTLAEVFLRQA